MRKAYLFGMLVVLSLLAVLTVQAQYETIRVTAQRFEGGEMIYRHDNGTIYALANARTAESGTTWMYESDAYGGQPSNALRAPVDRIAPDEGFGRVWANDTRLRNALGWATLEEVGYDARILERGATLYLETLEGIVYAIRPGNWTRIDSLPPGGGSGDGGNSDGDVSIDRFVVTPESAAPGDTLTVEWSVSGERVDWVGVRVFEPLRQVLVEDANGLSSAGSLTITVPDDALGDIEVRAVAREYQGTFGLGYPLESETIIVPLAIADQSLTTQAAYQDYQDGFMIWMAYNDEVLVFEDDGSYTRYAKRVYVDEPEPTDDDVPDGFFVPVNAFGRVWHSVHVQARVGYALAPEQGYDLIITQADGADVTYTLPDGSRIKLTTGSTWGRVG